MQKSVAMQELWKRFGWPSTQWSRLQMLRFREDECKLVSGAVKEAVQFALRVRGLLTMSRMVAMPFVVGRLTAVAGACAQQRKCTNCNVQRSWMITNEIKFALQTPTCCMRPALCQRQLSNTIPSAFIPWVRSPIALVWYATQSGAPLTIKVAMAAP